MARLLRRPRISGRTGYTLVEVVVAVLLTSIMVTAVFSVALTSKQGNVKTEHKMIASQATRRLSAALRNFVTGCDCDTATGICDMTSCTFLGPTPRPDRFSWCLNDPTNGIFDDRGDVWALTDGLHRVTGVGMLPAWFQAAPYNARIEYTVDNSALVEGRPVSQVNITVVWTEP